MVHRHRAEGHIRGRDCHDGRCAVAPPCAPDPRCSLRRVHSVQSPLAEEQFSHEFSSYTLRQRNDTNLRQLYSVFTDASCQAVKEVRSLYCGCNLLTRKPKGTSFLSTKSLDYELTLVKLGVRLYRVGQIKRGHFTFLLVTN